MRNREQHYDSIELDILYKNAQMSISSLTNDVTFTSTIHLVLVVRDSASDS